MPGPSDFGVDGFTVPAVLDRRARQYPDRVMMSIAGVDVTFEEMRQRSCAAANVLADLGVGRGDGVALFTATCPEWVYFWLGAARIGAVSAAINAANKGDFLLHTLRLSRAKVIFTDAERRPRVDEVAGGLDTVTDIVVQGDSLSEAFDPRPAGEELAQLRHRPQVVRVDAALRVPVGSFADRVAAVGVVADQEIAAGDDRVHHPRHDRPRRSRNRARFRRG